MGAGGGGGRPPAAQPSASSPRSPVPRIKWRKVDGSLSPQWATAEPTLQIPGVGFEDEGTYECEAENAKGRDTVQGRLIVQGRVRPAREAGGCAARARAFSPECPGDGAEEASAAAGSPRAAERSEPATVI